MFIVVNIGNTNTEIGFVGGQKLYVERRPTNTLITAEDFERLFAASFSNYSGNNCKPEGSILASVVPDATVPCFHALAGFTEVKPLVVGIHTKTDLDFTHYTDLPGSDRIAVCAAAWDRYNAPLVVIDMGTATTFNIVDWNGNFLGGAILPGLRMSLEALCQNTAQIPEIGLKKSAGVIGHNTEECLLTGAYYGTAAMVDGLIEDMAKTLGEDVKVVLTGGNAETVKPYIKTRLSYEPDLLLQGLAIIYRGNKRIPVEEADSAF